MSKEKSRIIENSLFFIVIFLTVLILTSYTNIEKNRNTERFATLLVNHHIINKADGLSQRYFMSDDLYNISKKNIEISEYIQIEDVISRIKREPFIKDAYIRENVIIEGDYFYTFFNQDGEPYILFNIFNSDVTNKVEDKVIIVSLEKELINNIVEDMNDLELSTEISNGINLSSITVIKQSSIISILGILLSLFTATSFLVVKVVLYKRAIYKHYEDEGLENIVMILSEKDKYTGEHSNGVSSLVDFIAKDLKLNKKETRIIKKAGKLHDIGKIAVSESILNKTGNLTMDEFEEIKKHSLIGYNIISQYSDLEEIANVILWHHEKIDGSGYPDGLKGEEIPKLAQILSVLDIYNALTTDRPYRKGFSKEEAFKIMEGMSINQEVVSVLKDKINQKNKEGN